jgi:predicted aspartyl protease
MNFTTKMMEYPYSRKFEPPAPVIKITLISPANENSIFSHQALIDTGADITTIPQAVIDGLDLMPARDIIAIGYDNTVSIRLTYYVNVRIEDFEFFPLEILSSPGKDFLIGRDILNQWTIVLDGKGQIFKIKK